MVLEKIEEALLSSLKSLAFVCISVVILLIFFAIASYFAIYIPQEVKNADINAEILENKPGAFGVGTGKFLSSIGRNIIEDPNVGKLFLILALFVFGTVFSFILPLGYLTYRYNEFIYGKPIPEKTMLFMEKARILKRMLAYLMYGVTMLIKAVTSLIAASWILSLIYEIELPRYLLISCTAIVFFIIFSALDYLVTQEWIGMPENMDK